jgi:thioesterase domain-containing protein
MPESEAKMIRSAATATQQHDVTVTDNGTEASGQVLSAVDHGQKPAEDERRVAALKIIGRALRLKSVSLADNYLSLCHDMRRTIIVIREIDKHFGIQLPLTLFMEAVTIGAIVDAVITRSIPPSTGIVELKAPGDHSSLPPVFVFPGLGGAVMELTDIARSLDYGGPVYGLPYPGLDGQSLPSSSIDPLADSSWNRIKSIQPTGPYLLLGYSAGGNVAVETARLIEAENQPVAFLGVIEPAVHERSVPFFKWLAFMIGRMRQGQARYEITKDVATQGKEESGRTKGTFYTRSIGKLSGVKRKLARILTRFRHRYGNPLKPGYVTVSPYYIGNLPSLVQSVRDMSIVFLARYRFRPYDGTVIYFHSELGDPLACDSHVVWRRFLSDVRFEQTPGDHATMIAPPHAQVLATKINRHLPRRQEFAGNN